MAVAKFFGKLTMIKAIVINVLNCLALTAREKDPVLEASSLSRLKAMRTKMEQPTAHSAVEKTDLVTRVRIKCMRSRATIHAVREEIEPSASEKSPCASRSSPDVQPAAPRCESAEAVLV